MLRRTATLVVLLAVLALLVFSVAPAGAHHKDGHENGGGKQSSGDVSEDDDGIPDDNDDNMHPSGKDRETNDGPTDDEQGKSASDPDDDGRGPDRSNGGPDKPGGSGGVDQDDQDGNNGCGNDDDFEDDNEGWCGGKPKPQPTTSPTTAAVAGARTEVCDKDLTMAGIQPCKEKDEEAEVLGQVETRTDRSKVLGERLFAAPQAAVRAARQVAAAAGAALPFTGAGLTAFLVSGLGLLGAGWFLVRRDA